MTDEKLFYQRSGRGPLLLLLHPVGLDSTFWGDLPQRLSRTHTVIAVDSRGHGRSPDAARPAHMRDYVGDVIALIEALGHGPAILLGVSFGGMIAQNLAIDRPDLVAGLIACGCPGVIPAAARAAILQRGADAEKGGMEAIVPATLERWFTPDFMSAPAVEAVRQRLLGNSPSNWAAAWEGVAEHDALAGLAGFAGPSLIVVGDSDAATPLDAAKALAGALPKGQLAILPGAPHILQLESAEAFAAAVAEFLVTLEQGRG